MFSTKTVIDVAWTLILAAGVVHAQPKPFVAHGPAAAAHSAAPAADIDMGMPGATTAPVAAASQPQPVAASQSVAATVPASNTVPHLSIDDLDQMTRQKIARQMSGGSGPGDGGVALNTPAPAAPPVVSRPAMPAQTKSAHERPRAEPVRFVGAFSDMTGGSVLYEYRGASYPAHVGTKLLNGWKVTKVEGFVVTVTEGGRTWTETIVGGARDSGTNDTRVAAFIPGRQLNDLGGPLPPEMQPTTMGQ